jgi:hypothetical protein
LQKGKVGRFKTAEKQKARPPTAVRFNGDARSKFLAFNLRSEELPPRFFVRYFYGCTSVLTSASQVLGLLCLSVCALVPAAFLFYFFYSLIGELHYVASTCSGFLIEVEAARRRRNMPKAC